MVVLVARSKLKVLDNLWIDFSTFVGMQIVKELDVRDDKVFPIFSVVALTPAGSVTLLSDSTSGTPLKCEVFIKENWLDK